VTGYSVRPLLLLEELSVQFRPRRGKTVYAVNGVDLAVARGEIFGLVGETGAGKSVTSHAILGLVRPPGRVTGGRVLLDGADLRALTPGELRSVRGARISYIPQNPRSALNPLLRIERQMRNVITSHERRRAAREPKTDERCRTMLAAVGIPDPDGVLRAYPDQLSGGMAQRVVIAIALLLGPELIIADEPTSGLDVIVQAQILELFTRAAHERGAAVLLVTHDLGVAAHYCQRVAVMYAGEILERGTVGEIFRSPAHPFTTGLLASVPVTGKLLRHMPGQTAQLHRPPHACTFAPRCPFATGECRTQRPPWYHLSDSHETFCHWPRGPARPSTMETMESQ
jgi:peptide/nickel transport system ATP-binding protein